MGDKAYDVIVIGAGMGGLVCATTLAKGGRKTLLIEKHAKAGGCVTSIRRGGFTFDMGAHLIGSCNRTGIMSSILRDLGVKTEFIRLRPTDRFTFGGDTVIEVPEEMDGYVEALGAMFPAEKDRIARFFDDMIRIYRNFSKSEIVERYGALTYQACLERYFSDERLKGILSAQSLYIGLPPARASFLAMVLMLVSYLRDGTYYPRSGTQALPDALLERYTSCGGDLLLGKEVDRIVMANGAPKGVRTADGAEYRAPAVVSNADARSTFSRMIGEEHCGKDFIGRMEGMRNSFSFFLMYMGVRSVGDAALRKIVGWHHEHFDLNRCFRSSFYLFVPTLVDASLSREGDHIIEFMMPFPHEYGAYRRWDDLAWREAKAGLEQAAVGKIEDLLGQKIGDKIVVKGSSTPRTIERYTANSQGSMYGWEMTPDQMHVHRLGYVTPFRNMYLTGHWTSPGCGVASVCISGWQVAKHIMKTAH